MASAQFHLVSAGSTPAFGRNGERLGALVATLVHSASGETQFGVLKTFRDARRRELVPVPWTIMAMEGPCCVADVDREKLNHAPHVTEAELGRFDTDFACLLDGVYGLEFPGIEGLNDLA